ncbi:unnamed protein product [Lota lota]
MHASEISNVGSLRTAPSPYSPQVRKFCAPVRILPAKPRVQGGRLGLALGAYYLHTLSHVRSVVARLFLRASKPSHEQIAALSATAARAGQGALMRFETEALVDVCAGDAVVPSISPSAAKTHSGKMTHACPTEMSTAATSFGANALKAMSRPSQRRCCGHLGDDAPPAKFLCLLPAGPQTKGSEARESKKAREQQEEKGIRKKKEVSGTKRGKGRSKGK